MSMRIRTGMRLRRQTTVKRKAILLPFAIFYTLIWFIGWTIYYTGKTSVERTKTVRREPFELMVFVKDQLEVTQ